MDKIITILYNGSFYLVLLSLLISFIRLLKGPTPLDRVVALDSMTVVSISLIVILAMMFGRIIYLDVALVYGLLSFLGVVAIARYIEGGM